MGRRQVYPTVCAPEIISLLVILERNEPKTRNLRTNKIDFASRFKSPSLLALCRPPPGFGTLAMCAYHGSVVGYLTSPVFAAPIADFIDLNCAIFHGSTEEHAIEETLVFERYQALVEQLLESFLQGEEGRGLKKNMNFCLLSGFAKTGFSQQQKSQAPKISYLSGILSLWHFIYLSGILYIYIYISIFWLHHNLAIKI